MKKLKFLFVLVLGVLFCNSCTNKVEQPFEGNNQVFFKLLHGNYLTENRNNENQLVFTAGASNAWEVFYIYYNQDNTVKIKSSTGHFLCYHQEDSLIKADVTDEKLATLFLLIPHKQYFEIKIENVGDVIINESLHLKVSATQKPQLFVIKNHAGIPASWFSLRKIKWERFFSQLVLVIGLILLGFSVFRNKLRSNKISLATVIILGFILIYVQFNTKKWKENKIIASDVVGYYEYLPAAFIFNDMSFKFRNDTPNDFKGTVWVREDEKTGRGTPKMTMGLSFMYAPFFFIGHGLAYIQNYTTYGYSEPYGMMLVLGCWFYVFIALFYLRKILLIYFNDTVTAFTLFSVVLATNLFYYVTIESGMSHAFSFFLVTIFLWNTLAWYRDIKLKTAVYIGLVIGLISLVRPTNALIAIIFIFYGVSSIESLKKKVKLFLEYKKHILTITIFALIMWIPQLVFWKYATGSWFFFSYGDEGFFFSNPHIIEGLFSYRKGWLLYTPIMLFALVGIGFLYQKQKELFFPILLFTPLNVYIVYSWWCWYYGGSFGSRPMIDSYPLLAIPLGAFFYYFDKKTNYLKTIPVIIIIFTVSLNLFQTQQTKTCLHWAGMTKEAYWTNFTTLGWPNGFEEMIREPDNESLSKGLDEYPEEGED